MQQSQCAYVAGILDGEGCIRIARKKSKRSMGGYSYAVTVNVGNTCLPLLQWLRATTKLGRINPKEDRSNKNTRPAWVWTIWSNQAKTLIEQVYPFLLVKRAQADVAFKFFAQIQFGIGSKGLSEEQRAVQHDLCLQMKCLNLTGRKPEHKEYLLLPAWAKKALVEGWTPPPKALKAGWNPPPGWTP